MGWYVPWPVDLSNYGLTGHPTITAEVVSSVTNVSATGVPGLAYYPDMTGAGGPVTTGLLPER